MIRRRQRAALACLVIVGLVAGGCGDDEPTSGSAGDVSDEAGGGEGSEASSTVSIEMVDYGYEVSGSLTSGVQTFETSNTGDEIHMIGFGRLKEGVTIEQAIEKLSAMGEGEGEGQDPFAELFEEEEIGTPGQVLFPGESQKITLEDGLAPGTYALICFIPTEEEGIPHFAKGMINSLEVVDEEGDGELPAVDAEYSLPDEAEPEGPTELPSGEVTLALTNAGAAGKDVGIGQLDEGTSFDAFDEFFQKEFEGEGPPASGVADRAPGRIAAFTFEIPPGKTVYLTTDLDAGQWGLINTTNVEGDDGEDTVDHVLTLEVE